MRNVRLLFLGGGPSMPTSQSMETLKFEYFSKYFSGDIITSIRNHKHTVIKSIGNFRYHPIVVKGNMVSNNMRLIAFYIKKALELSRTNGKFDIIIASNPLLNGLVALLLGKITGARIIIEVNGNFESAFKYGKRGEINPSWIESVKELFSKAVIPFVLKKANIVKLLSDNQLEPFRLNKNTLKIKDFPDFVPVKEFMEHPCNDRKYILLVGYPWYLKGVDLLIKAFNMISYDFPDYHLKIVGWCPEGRDYYEKLTENNLKIELCDPVYYHDIIPIMANCSMYVLASRTEAMGRVLIEAMSCKKPIIASNVGGVYSIVKDGYNGLLFEKENVVDLADKIRYMLSHTEISEQLGENGFQYVKEYLSEECYIDRYKKLIYDCLDG